MNTLESAARIKRAELLSSVGAGVLGAGIALLWADRLAGFASTILLLGLVSHAGGMFQKHGLEQGSPRVWWADALYRFCWIALAALALFVLVSQT